jgi:hypothetical protein
MQLLPAAAASSPPRGPLQRSLRDWLVPPSSRDRVVEVPPAPPPASECPSVGSWSTLLPGFLFDLEPQPTLTPGFHPPGVSFPADPHSTRWVLLASREEWVAAIPKFTEDLACLIAMHPPPVRVTGDCRNTLVLWAAHAAFLIGAADGRPPPVGQLIAATSSFPPLGVVSPLPTGVCHFGAIDTLDMSLRGRSSRVPLPAQERWELANTPPLLPVVLVPLRAGLSRLRRARRGLAQAGVPVALLPEGSATPGPGDFLCKPPSRALSPRTLSGAEAVMASDWGSVLPGFWVGSRLGLDEAGVVAAARPSQVVSLLAIDSRSEELPPYTKWHNLWTFEDEDDATMVDLLFPMLLLLERLLWGTGPVYVHCRQGVHRAPTMVIIFALVCRSMDGPAGANGTLSHCLDAAQGAQRRRSTRYDPAMMPINWWGAIDALDVLLHGRHTRSVGARGQSTPPWPGAGGPAFAGDWPHQGPVAIMVASLHRDAPPAYALPYRCA